MILIGQRVIIIPEQPIQTTEGGIYLPDTVKQERNTGLVVHIGEEVDLRFDKRQVLFNRMAKTDMVYEGLPCIMLYVHDIIAILD